MERKIIYKAPEKWDILTRPHLKDITREDNAIDRYISWAQHASHSAMIPVVRCTDNRYHTLSVTVMKKLWHGIRLDTLDSATGPGKWSMIPPKLIEDKLRAKDRFQRNKLKTEKEKTTKNKGPLLTETIRRLCTTHTKKHTILAHDTDEYLNDGTQYNGCHQS
jgi:hypothetical protein